MPVPGPGRVLGCIRPTLFPPTLRCDCGLHQVLRSSPGASTASGHVIFNDASAQNVVLFDRAGVVAMCGSAQVVAMCGLGGQVELGRSSRRSRRSLPFQSQCSNVFILGTFGKLWEVKYANLADEERREKV